MKSGTKSRYQYTKVKRFKEKSRIRYVDKKGHNVSMVCVREKGNSSPIRIPYFWCSVEDRFIKIDMMTEGRTKTTIMKVRVE